MQSLPVVVGRAAGSVVVGRAAGSVVVARAAGSVVVKQEEGALGFLAAAAAAIKLGCIVALPTATDAVESCDVG
jgi:hypothetical protein